MTGAELVLLAGVPEEEARALTERLAPLPARPARDAAEVLELAAAGRLRALLLHHAFPAAEETLRRLRAAPGGAALPVVYCALCDGDGRDGRVFSEELGVACVLCDPLDTAAATRRLTTLLASGPPAQAPPADRSAQLDTAVAALWQRFRGGVLERVTVLEEATVALLGSALDAELRRRAEREAHKLAGAVGTFGFPEASRTARSVELLLQGDAPLAPDDALRLSDWVLELRTRLEQPPAPAAPPAAGPERPLLLLVGAEAELAERVEMEAEGRGLAVRRAPSLPAAEAELRAAAPAAVLLDPGADPLSAGWLRLMDQLARRTPAPALLVLSATDTFAERVDAARHGAAAFLHKPLPPTLVVDTVARLVAPGDIGGYKVMLVDDDAHVRALVGSLLSARGLEIVEVSDPLRFWTELGRTRPDLVVLDQDMPGLSGLEICRVLRNDPRWRALPVLFLTARTEPEFVQRIFAAGADDYVAKPVVGPELVTRAVSRLERVRLEAGAAQAEGPGGLPGRERAAAEAGRLLQLARRSDAPVAVGRIDLDGFDRFNAELGHAAGDEVLKRTARLLHASVPAGDLVASWGGDEFLVALYGAERDQGAALLRRVLAAVAREPIPLETGSLTVTFSAGVAAFPADGSDLDAVVAAAEQALVAAKEAGGAAVLEVGAATPGGTELLDVALVEDDRILAELLMHALQSQGYRARWIADGDEAVALLAGARPALRARVVLLDVDLPTRDGLAVLREMARTGTLERTAVVMLTVRSTEGEVLRSLELGATDHVSKPFSVPVLLRRVRALLGRG